MRTPGSSAAQIPAEIDALAARLPVDLKVAAKVPGQVNAGELHPLEMLLMTGESTERRQQFSAGRQCARNVLSPLQGTTTPLLRRRDGAPDWPPTVRGSISHKSGLCLAIAGPAETLSGVGIDLEAHRALPAPIWARVFTAAELPRLHVLPPAVRAIRARLCFSAKECYYKWYRSHGGTGEPDFCDVEVDVAGTTLLVHPVSTSGLPAVGGCFVQGDKWLITVLWSYATPAAHESSSPKHDKSSLEVDHHDRTHPSAIHP